MPSNELVPFLIREVEKKLAIELFRKQLSKDIDTDSIDECPVCQHFMKRMLSDKTDSYAIQAKVNLPIIGIGAPINYFLPKAGEYLNAEIIIPEDADVANALGAITSKIFIRKKVLIRPDQNGYFLVEGVVGRKIFDQIAMAEEWAIEHLKKQIWELGRLAGTSRKRVELSIEDSIVNLSEGDSLFLGRTIEACLTGNPDILLRMVS